jgi:putative ergosteryl-3beta-O-L-aspartate hydrolase
MAPWWLLVQAVFWRLLMRVGMALHSIGFGRPPRPSFTRRIPVVDGVIVLHFYCPSSYFENQDRQSHKDKDPNGGAIANPDAKQGLSSPSPKRFPLVVNFHGGGFTLGQATDDARWAQCVMQETGAVVISVDYRQAPEHPFPTAVDDGVEALLYLAAHAVDLHLNLARLAMTGFSAGGNLAITVLLRLRERVRSDGSARTLLHSSALQAVCIIAWYPVLDFVADRECRRAASVKPSKTLHPCLTNLFDDSYLPDVTLRASPFASPGRAPDDMLAEGLPCHIFLYTCEWDLLLHEAQHFVRRLESLGKRVRSMMIGRVRHAWDKSPSPFRDQASVDTLYRVACAEMRPLFEE